MHKLENNLCKLKVHIYANEHLYVYDILYDIVTPRKRIIYKHECDI